MSNSTNATLQNAFDLIENNELENAQNILQPLLETESNNPAVWWVYAHSLRDPEEGMKAIDKVIQLDPTYPGASDLKSQLASINTPVPETSETDESIDDWDDLDLIPDSEPSDSMIGGRSPIRSLLIAIIVIILVVGIFAVLSSVFGGGSQPEPTQVAINSTVIPTANIQIVTNVSATETLVESVTTEPTEVVLSDEPTTKPTEIIPTDEPTTEPTEIIPTDKPTTEPTEIMPTDEPTTESIVAQSSYESLLVESLATYSVSEADLQIRDTSLGTTLDVTICAIPGPQSSVALNDVMATFVEFNSGAPENVVAFAVTLLDCNNDQSVARTIGVERRFVQSFSDDEIAIKDFQREWKPLS